MDDRTHGKRRRWRWKLVVPGLVLLLAVGAFVIPRVSLSRLDGPTSWEATAERFTESVLLPDGLLIYDKYTVRKVNPGDGVEVFSVPTDGDHVVVGGDGSFVQLDTSRTAYYAADGQRLWSRKHDRVPAVTAIGDGNVVLATCRDKRCTYQAISSSGDDLWRRVARDQEVGYRTATESRTHIDSEYEPIKIAPAVPALEQVQGRPRDALVIMSMDGKLIKDMRASLVGVVGDLVVVAVDRCQYAGLRDGKEAWRTKDLPCTNHEVPPPRLLSHRMYLGKHHDKSKASAYTVSLETGQWRAIRPVVLTSRTPQGDIPGDDVLVERGPGGLTGVNASTGAELWTHEVPKGKATGIRAQNGAVLFETPASGRLLELADPDLHQRSLVTVLDAKTGRQAARFLMAKDDRLTYGYGIGPGRAYVTLESGTAVVLGGS